MMREKLNLDATSKFKPRLNQVLKVRYERISKRNRRWSRVHLDHKVFPEESIGLLETAGAHRAWREKLNSVRKRALSLASNASSF